MATAIGRKGWIGLIKEATPGAPLVVTTFLTNAVDFPLVDKHEPIGDIAVKGIRDQQFDSVSGKQWGEGSFTVNLDETKIGHLLLGIMGTVSSATVAGAIKDHTFTKNDSNTPQTFTVTVDRVAERKFFPYSVFKSLEMSFSDDLATAKVDVLSRFPITTTSGTLVTVSGHMFAWKDAKVRFGTTISGAITAAHTPVNDFSITIDNSSIVTWRSGSQEPASIDHGSFRIFGSFKIYFEDATQLNNFRALTKQSMQVQFLGRGLAGALQESLTINLHKIRLQEATVETPSDDLNVLICTFEAEYDNTSGLTRMADIVLRNITASY